MENQKRIWSAARVLGLTLLLCAVAAACANDRSSDVGRLNQSCLEPIGDCEVAHALMYGEDGSRPGGIQFVNNDTEFLISFNPEGGWEPGSWLVESVAVYAGPGPIPADPSLYPVQHYYGGVDSMEAVMALPLEVGCGGTLLFATVVTLVRDGPDGAPEYLDAYVGGPREDWQPDEGWHFGIPLEGGGWYAEYVVCCEGTGCTYTQGYWKNHPEDWPTDSLTIGGVTYSDSALMDLLQMSPRRDASMNLAHQLIAARLNVANDASVPFEVDLVLADAEDWMAANAEAGGGYLPYGIHPRNAPEAVELADALAAYNEGQAGTIHCDMLPEEMDD